MLSTERGAPWGAPPTPLGLTGPVPEWRKDKSSVRCKHLRFLLYHCSQVAGPFKSSLPGLAHSAYQGSEWGGSFVHCGCPQRSTTLRFPGQKSTDDLFPRVPCPTLRKQGMSPCCAASDGWSPLSSLLRRAGIPNPSDNGLPWGQVGALLELLPSLIFCWVICQNKTDSQKRNSSAF